MTVGVLIASAGRNDGGPEVYEREIARAMLAVAPQHEYHLYCLDSRASGVIGLKSEKVFYHQLQPQVRAAALLASLPRAMARTRPDVFYAPVIPPPFCPPQAIISMPCSSLLHHPEFYPPLVRMRLRFLFHRAVWKAARIICPSHQVRESVQERLKVPFDRLPVIHPGVSPLFRRIDEEEKRQHVEEKHGIRSPYFLFSGRWEARKNLVRTLEAFALFKRRLQTDHKLVLTGGQSWNAKEVWELLEQPALRDAVVNLGKTESTELPYLYGGADALLYASLWEGFGLPIIESMACGTPVITSNLSAMPETADGAALLVDPYSVDDIAAAMSRIAADANLRERLGEQGFRRAQCFNWEKTAQQTLNLCQEIAS
jgi:glycosyltransferase involved in cell wall biosynthesis